MLNIAEYKTGEEGKEWRDNGTDKTGADGSGTNTDNTGMVMTVLALGLMMII